MAYINIASRITISGDMDGNGRMGLRGERKRHCGALRGEISGNINRIARRPAWWRSRQACGSTARSLAGINMAKNGISGVNKNIAA
jgi:hypothetical protein